MANFKDFEKSVLQEALNLAKKNAKVDITCPNCQEDFTAKSGENHCPHCQADIELNIKIDK